MSGWCFVKQREVVKCGLSVLMIRNEYATGGANLARPDGNRDQGASQQQTPTIDAANTDVGSSYLLLPLLLREVGPVDPVVLQLV